MAKKSNWIAKAAKRIAEKGTEGAFTQQAHSAGFSDVLAYARHVLANKSKYDTGTIRRAVFALNANK